MREDTIRQVRDFFDERGLVPVVAVKYVDRLHAAPPGSEWALCPRSRGRGQVMRPAEGAELLRRQCRDCLRQRFTEYRPSMGQVREVAG